MNKFQNIFGNKMNSLRKSEGFKSVFAAMICAMIGIFIGYIILLIINAEHATTEMGTILKSYMFFKRPNMRLTYLGSTLVKSVPLILCGVSVLFSYKAGLFNIGVAGQYCVGIGITLWSALYCQLPWWLCVILATLVVALWAVIVGIFKAFFNINEVIAGIMMNWIGLYLVNMLLQNESTMNLAMSETYSIDVVSPSSLLPSLGLDKFFNNNEYVTIAIPLTIVIVVFIWFLLKKTTLGYELTATGLNKHAAKYAGMREKYNIVLTMAISGALAGIAAAFFYLTDIQGWKTSASIPGMGFNGIAVAFLGGLNPIGVIFAGYFIQHITLGGSLIDMKYFNPQISDLIASIIIYACAFVLFIKDMMSKSSKRKNKDLKE